MTKKEIYFDTKDNIFFSKIIFSKKNNYICQQYMTLVHIIFLFHLLK